MFNVWSKSNSEKWRCQKKWRKFGFASAWFEEVFFGAIKVFLIEQPEVWESTNHVISPTDFPGWYGNSMKFHVFFHEVNWSSMKKMLVLEEKPLHDPFDHKKKNHLPLPSDEGRLTVLGAFIVEKLVVDLCPKQKKITISNCSSCSSQHCPNAGAKSSKPLPKEKSLNMNRFIIQHLQRGAKWFLKGINSPSLRV